MYARGSRLSLALCACLLLAACASTQQPAQPIAQQSGGYWSQVEEFGTNPAPEGYGTEGDATFYPYVQAPRAYDGYAGYGAYGGVGSFDQPYGPYGIPAPAFRSFYYADSFYGSNPYLYGGPIFVPAPGVAPRPRPVPPPSASKPPPHPVTPRPPRPPIATAPPPPPRPAPPPRERADRGAQPVKD